MKKVLLINDSKFESMVMADMFQGLGYETSISDEFNALVDIERIQPHLIVVEYMMEEIRGDMLIQIIRTSQPQVICILSHSNEVAIESIRTNGIDGIIKKPVSMSTLTDLLKKVIEPADVQKQDEGKKD